MADDKPGPAKSTTQKHTLDVSPRFMKFVEELDLPDDVTNLILANQTLKRFQFKVDPAEIALLGGGFYLGYSMNMRPGIEVPGPLGPFFLGLPDFGGRVRDLTEDVERQEETVASLKRSAVIIEQDQDCIAHCEEARRFHAQANLPFDYEACIKACESETMTLTPAIGEAKAKLARLKAELQKHRIAQGFLFLIMTWVLTRPGFLTGIGEIIPG